ncbi:spermidine hydroxycinnamoyl transferase-like [Rhododendron vialii]|uniref:spermidine hydroxycinnamoyl transferase-like n=1 Tax=Rhododendron vialii TaxID=182163 RepID=UPI00265DE6BA|nr:spermidine hydroxycinnamoyl transferase-like [Rhododendron vialii]
MLTLKASYTVKPMEPSPTGLLYLSDFDLSVALTHGPVVYFYRPISGHLLNPIEILKNSLGKALTIFYPLAGRLQRTGRGRLEVNCNSMGALFLETESEAKISDFGDFTPTSKTRALIPSVDYNKPIDELPLLLVQVTNFSCGGISLGLGISHVLVDGRCAAHFVSEWARIARGEEPENLPFLDRTALKLEEDDLTPPRFGHLEFGKPPMLIGQKNNLEEQKKETTVVMLKLSKEQIKKLKKEANEFPSVYTSSKPFTRYEAVTAHMWRCTSKARLHEIEQLTSVRVGVDFHSRMVPPLPKHYFGNAVSPMRATTTSGELLSKPLGYGCSKIREAIEKVTDEYIRSSLAYMKREKDLSKFRYSHVVGSTQGAFLGNPNIVITSWISLPFCGVDFGWGKEIYIAPGAIPFDGRSFILPSRDEDGSFDAPFRLQVEHMDAFKKFFYENIMISSL